MTTQKIQNIINHYKKWRKENLDTWIEHCRNQTNIEDAIGFAALAENHEGMTEELPMPFNDNDLTNAEIEDILCIYKDRFDSWTGS